MIAAAVSPKDACRGDPYAKSMSEQLGLFERDGAEPVPADLAGLLLGPGHLVSRNGRARCSVLVTEAWRAEELVGEFQQRGLGGEYNVSRDEASGTQFVARTDFVESLTPLASASPRTLSPGGLRLWLIAAGRFSEGNYYLGLALNEEARWPHAGAALAQLGLPAAFVGPRGGGPAYRIASAKRLRLLRTLAGERPATATATDWP